MKKKISPLGMLSLIPYMNMVHDKKIVIKGASATILELTNVFFTLGIMSAGRELYLTELIKIKNRYNLTIDELLSLIKSNYPYRDLEEIVLDLLTTMLHLCKG